MAKKSRTKTKRGGKKPSGSKQKTSNAFPWRYLAMPMAIGAGGVALLIYLAVDVDTIAGRGNQEADQWAVAYWRKPIPPQGRAPADFLPAAKKLLPKDCGSCHPAQLADWSQSLHAAAMGPGVAGQFPRMHPGERNQCRECHTPMNEQYGYLPQGGQWTPNPNHNPELAAQGLVCAACHLRRHRRHGPPLREGREAVSQLVHGEPVRTGYFEASEFCKGCHQHASTTMKVNGKPVENTYQEWLESPYPERGTTCQTCHMPDRRHLWKGIHDKEMTASGVTIGVSADPAQPVVGRQVVAELKITNTGTGHAFPTYTTPAVFLRAAFVNGSGQVLPGDYYEEKILQRRLDMSVSPWGEHFDTRILPEESATLTFDRVVPPEAHALKLWVWVEPDQFYTGFFKSRLRGGENFQGADLLRQALSESLQRQYKLFDRTIPIVPDGAN